MNARHPSRRRLQRWLDGDASRRVSKHIERCAHCQDVLDEVSALDDDLVADLEAATDPPRDLTERTHDGVDIRLRNEAAIGSFVDLFTIGFDFARTVLDPELTPGDDAQDAATTADVGTGGQS